MNIEEKTLRLKTDFDDVYEAGKKNERIRFMKEYQDYGTRKNYYCAFSGLGWDYNTYFPIYDICCSGDANSGTYMFYFSRIRDTKVPIRINTGSTSIKSVFAYNPNLITIAELDLTNYSGSFSGWFNGCTNIKDINIIGEIKNNGFNISASTNLSADSLKGIINALSTTATNVTITLPVTAQANYDAVYGEGAWVELVGDNTEAHPGIRPNWTIAYA